MFPSENNFKTEVTLEKFAAPIADDEPFHILMLGDWSGRNFAFSNSADPPEFSASEIDRDNFEDVLASFQIKLDLDLKTDANNIVTVEIKEFDDFHPDNIFRQLPFFSQLRDIRQRLQNSETFNSAAREVQSWLSTTDEEINVQKNAEQSLETTFDSHNLLDQILNQASSSDDPAPKPQASVKSDLNALISKLVKPYRVDTDEAEQSKLLEIVDKVTGELMREILHHPHFQALESAWRGLYFLVRRTQTNSELKLFISDIGKEQLSTHLKSVANLAHSTFYNLINEDDWSVICGNFEFKIEVDDIAFLIRLAQICRTANAPFLSYLTPKFFKNTPTEDNFDIFFDDVETKLWNSLRSIPESAYLGLALPRFIARLPFGSDTEPLDSFSFEEFENSVSASEYIWINPVFSCAFLLAKSFNLYGWKLNNNFQLQIDDLPFHNFLSSDDVYITKSLEFSFKHNECINLMDLGLMTFITFENSDHIRLVRFQSISNENTSLYGKWNKQ